MKILFNFDAARQEIKPELLFTPQTSSFGKLYASVLIKITNASSIDTSPFRFLGFGKLNTGGSISGASHIFVKSDGNDVYNLGIKKYSP